MKTINTAVVNASRNGAARTVFSINGGGFKTASSASVLAAALIAAEVPFDRIDWADEVDGNLADRVTELVKRAAEQAAPAPEMDSAGEAFEVTTDRAACRSCEWVGCAACEFRGWNPRQVVALTFSGSPADIEAAMQQATELLRSRGASVVNPAPRLLVWGLEPGAVWALVGWMLGDDTQDSCDCE